MVTVATLDDGDARAAGPTRKDTGDSQGVYEGVVDDGGGLCGGVGDEEGPGLGMGRGRPLVDPTMDGDGGKEAEEDGETAYMMRQRALLAAQASAGTITSSLV